MSNISDFLFCLILVIIWQINQKTGRGNWDTPRVHFGLQRLNLKNSTAVINYCVISTKRRSRKVVIFAKLNWADSGGHQTLTSVLGRSISAGKWSGQQTPSCSRWCRLSSCWPNLRQKDMFQYLWRYICTKIRWVWAMSKPEIDVHIDKSWRGCVR